MIPICASKEGGARFCGIGEGASFGIWKDTDEMEVCKAFLNYVHRMQMELMQQQVKSVPYHVKLQNLMVCS